MKIKRILSLAVVLAMVMAVVPMFGITASAAETKTVAEKVGAKVIWSMPDTNWGNDNVNASALGEGWYNSGQLFLKGTNLILGNSAAKGKLVSPGFAHGAEKIVVEMKFNRDTGFSKDFAYQLQIKDTDDNIVANAWLDRGSNDPIAENPWGFANGNHEFALVIENNYEAGTHTNTWYVDGEDVTMKDGGVDKNAPIAGNGLPMEGIANGFGGIDIASAYYGDYGNSPKVVNFSNVTISAVYPSVQDEHTVKGALDGIKLGTAAKKQVTLNTPVQDATNTNVSNIEWKSSAPEIVGDNGTVVKSPDEVTPVTFTPSVSFGGKTITGSAKTVYIFPESYKDATVKIDGLKYKVSGENIITNGDFATDTTGWTAGKGTEVSPKNWVRDTENDVTWLRNALTDGNSGGTGTSNLRTFWDLTEKDSNKYLISYYTYSPYAVAAGNHRMQAAALSTAATEANDNNAFDKAAGGHSSWPSPSPRDIAIEEGWSRKTYILDKEKLTKSADKVYAGYATAWGDMNFGVTGFELYAVTLEEPIDVTVTLKDEQKNIGEYKTKDYNGDTVTVPRGVYAKQTYIDADETSTAITEGKAEAAAKELDKFTWDTNNNAVSFIGLYNSYNTAYIETWSGSGELSTITSYVYVDIPSKTENQQYVMEIAGKWNSIDNSRGEGESNAPGFGIGLITDSVETVKNIDLTKGEETSAALADLSVTDIIPKDDKYVPMPADWNSSEKTGTVKIAVPTDKELTPGKAVLKIYASRRGTCAIGDLKIVAVDTPTAPTASLGWDESDKQFTLNFTKADEKPGDAVLVGDKSADWGENSTAVVKVGDKTNAIVTAYATAASDVVKSNSVKSSVYELVVKDIVDHIGDYNKGTVGADRIAAANEVISHGGFYYTETGEDKADDVTKQIVKVDVTDETLTAEIKQEYKGFGLGFVIGADSTVYFGSSDTAAVVGENSGTFDKLVITLPDGTITSASEVTLEAADGTVVTLDAVNIEFVETLVEELEAAGADADIALTPEL